MSIRKWREGRTGRAVLVAIKTKWSFLHKQEREWPSQVNRLWAVSHSWHTHNYSISSTINGNALKLQGEIKQTPSPYSSNLSASTRPLVHPSAPSIPSPPSPYTLSSLSNTLFNHLLMPPSLCRAHIYIRCTCPLVLLSKRQLESIVPRAAQSVCGYMFVSVRLRDRKGGSVMCHGQWGFRRCGSIHTDGLQGNNMCVFERHICGCTAQ